MKISSIANNDGKNLNFNGRILTKENKRMVSALKSRLENFQTNGLPIGDCYYKIPENSRITLKTNGMILIYCIGSSIHH